MFCVELRDGRRRFVQPTDQQTAALQHTYTQVQHKSLRIVISVSQFTGFGKAFFTFKMSYAPTVHFVSVHTTGLCVPTVAVLS
jgi:hypothetical protein